jgi:hypothetical protein
LSLVTQWILQHSCAGSHKEYFNTLPVLGSHLHANLEALVIVWGEWRMTWELE